MFLGLFANAGLNYVLFLTNPDELEAQARKVLREVLPNFAPEFRSTSFNVWTQRLIAHGVTFYEKGDPSRVLLKVERIELRAVGLPPSAFKVTLVRPTVTVRIDSQGRVNLPLPEEPSEPSEGAASLPVGFDVAVEDGRVLVDMDYQGLGQHVVIDGITVPESAPLQVARDLTLLGRGSLRVGVLLPPTHPLYAGAEPLERLPSALEGRRFRGLFDRIDVAASAAEGHATHLEVGGQLTITSLIKDLLPTPFDTIWRQLNPTQGAVDVDAQIAHDSKHGMHVAVGLRPRAAGIRLRGLPVPIHDIEGGRFEITAALPPDGPLAFLGVHWEGISARVGTPKPGDSARPQLLSRGTIYPGREAEGISMFVYVDAHEVELTPELTNAFPDPVKQIYAMFDPRGTIGRGYVTIFKSPFEHDVVTLDSGEEIPGRIQHQDATSLTIRDIYGAIRTVPTDRVAGITQNDEPLLSILVPELGGRVSACFVGDPDDPDDGVPVRIENVRGSFQLRESSNVTVLATGDLEVGGRAEVSAQVLEGDLISVDVQAIDVPVSDRVIAVLPSGSREVAQSFHLEGGAFDAHVRVEKSAADRPAQPIVALDLEQVAFRHDLFQMPLRTPRGHVRVVPVFETLDQEGPSRIEVELDAELEGDGVVAAVASGVIVLPPVQPPDRVAFTSDLDVRAESVDCGRLPPRGKELLAPVGPPRGVVHDLVAHVEGPTTFHARGRGESLQAIPQQVPYANWVDSFDVELTGADALLHDVRGRAFEGGTYALTGRIGLPEAHDGGADVDLHLDAAGLPLTARLVAALPETVRGALEPLRAEGPVSGRLDVRMAPGQPSTTTGQVELEGVTTYLDRLSSAAVVRTDGTRLVGATVTRGEDDVVLRRPGQEDLVIPLAVVDRVEPNPLAQLVDAPATDVRGRVVLHHDRIELRDLRGRFGGAAATARGSLGLGETFPFEVTTRLDALVIDEGARALAGPTAEAFFERFAVDGPTDLTFEVRRAAAAGESVHVDLIAEPRGMTVVAALLPLPITDVTGRIELRDGEPTVVEVEGDLEPPDVPLVPGRDDSAPRLRVERRAANERPFPDAGGAGRVYHVTVGGMRRYEEPARRKAFERQLPESWRALLDYYAPAGLIDIEAFAYQPFDERLPIRWVAEFGLADVGLNMGAMRFDGIEGRARLQGSLAELALGSCDGELQLAKLDYYDQTFRDVSGPLSVSDGILRLGRLGQPFVGELYEGEFRGRVEYAFETGRYGGSIRLGGLQARDGDLGAMMREMAELKTEALEQKRKQRQLDQAVRELAYREDRGDPGDASRIAYLRTVIGSLQGEVDALGRVVRSGSTIPYRGGISAALDFDGGGPGLLGQPRPFAGTGELRFSGSNLLDIPAMKKLHGVLNPFFGGGTSTDALPNLEMRFRAGPSAMQVTSLRLWGPTMTVRGEDGTIRYDGTVDLPIVPFNAEGGVHRFLRYIPGTGWRVTGPIWNVEVSGLGGLSSLKWLRDLLTPDRD